jgi:branched-chain amino acid transport system ATP-binding protein
LTVIKNYGQSILIIDKNLEELMKIADRHYVMEKGRVVWTGDTAQMSTNDQLKARYLGV